MQIRASSAVLFLFLMLPACTITDYIGNLNLEVMRPGIINFPENADTIAVFYDATPTTKRDTFLFFDGLQINRCAALNGDALFKSGTDSLVKNLGKSGYFQKTLNYGDSVRLAVVYENKNPDRLFQTTKADACIVLRKVSFDQPMVMPKGFLSVVPTRLDWNILFRNDSAGYDYHQADTLIYDYRVVAALVKKDNPELLLENAAGYMGKNCAKKLLPDWMPVKRMYYRSGNPEMRKAEKSALNNDWMSAAEIWNRMSKSKNQRLAAKAAFNMGLACEMEGKPELAVDWVLHAASNNTGIDADLHRANCQRYLVILNKRKKDIERLRQQVRGKNFGNSSSETTPAF
jgi:hypothetical protein